MIPIPTLTVIAIQTALGQARPREDGVQLASEMYDRNNLLCMCVCARLRWGQRNGCSHADFAVREFVVVVAGVSCFQRLHHHLVRLSPCTIIVVAVLALGVPSIARGPGGTAVRITARILLRSGCHVGAMAWLTAAPGRSGRSSVAPTGVSEPLRRAPRAILSLAPTSRSPFCTATDSGCKFLFAQPRLGHLRIFLVDFYLDRASCQRPAHLQVLLDTFKERRRRRIRVHNLRIHQRCVRERKEERSGGDVDVDSSVTHLIGLLAVFCDLSCPFILLHLQCAALLNITEFHVNLHTIHEA